MIDLSTKKYFVYDFDGTIDTIQVNWSGWRVGLEKTIQKMVSGFEYGDYSIQSFKIQNSMIKKHGPKLKHALEEFQKNFEKENYFGHISNEKLVAYIKQKAQEGSIKQFVWTSNHSETVMPVLKELGLENVFEMIVARDSALYQKPDPVGFDLIYVEGTDLSEYLMIGDNPLSDGDAAKAAGFDYVHVDEFMKMI